MIDETSLNKGQLRKLNALRKSVGSAIADEAFAKWLDQAREAPETDEKLRGRRRCVVGAWSGKESSRSGGAAISYGGAASA